jgi:hypothetical protein
MRFSYGAPIEGALVAHPSGLHGTRLGNWLSAIRRVRGAYRAAHGRSCNLLRPRRYTEKIQWRKLFDLDPRLAILCDKLAVRAFISERIGDTLLTPLLWSGSEPEAAPLESIERPFIVKSSHAAGHIMRVRSSDSLDSAAACETFRYWLRQNHGTRMDEPGYVFVQPRLMIERLLSRPDGAPPIERKIWVFDGRVRLVQTLLNDGGSNHHAAFHDRTWSRVDWCFLSPPNPENFAPPPQLDQMIEAAERLGAEFEHIRVDFYDTHDRIWIGEMTPYPYSGLVPFAPDQADFIMGSFWRIKRPILRATDALLRGRHEIQHAQDDAERH